MRFPLCRALAATGAILAVPVPAAATAHAGPPMLWEAVADLPVAAESREGYKRSSFNHWVDADRNGCDTRREVLVAEALDPPQIGPGCELSGGRWYSYYDDKVVYSADDLHIDHVVALAEAFDSGASAWSAAQREQYANYLDRPEHLIAVTGRSKHPEVR
jgi:hypothetical protein